MLKQNRVMLLSCRSRPSNSVFSSIYPELWNRIPNSINVTNASFNVFKSP